MKRGSVTLDHGDERFFLAGGSSSSMASTLLLYLGTLVTETKGWSDDSRLQASHKEEGLESCCLTQVLGN